MNAGQKSAVLAQSQVFSSVKPETLLRLAESCRLKSFGAGDVIFNEGTPAREMMVVAKGTVRICIVAPTARNVTLAEQGPGDIFGEIAMLDGGGRTAQAVAQTKCQILVVQRSDLFRVLQSSPDLSTALLEYLCARIRQSDERTIHFAFLGLPKRLAHLVLSLTNRGESAPALTKLAYSQSDLADMVGSSREHVNRCLRQWKSDGTIDLKDGWLILLDRPSLQATALKN